MMGGVLRSITDDSLIDRSLRWVVRWWRRSGRGRDDAANLIPMALVSTPTSPAHAHPGGGGETPGFGGRQAQQTTCVQSVVWSV